MTIILDGNESGRERLLIAMALRETVALDALATKLSPLKVTHACAPPGSRNLYTPLASLIAAAIAVNAGCLTPEDYYRET